MAMRKGTNVPVPTTAMRVELAWSAGPEVPQADAAALLLVSGKVRSEADLVAGRRPAHASGAIRHQGRRRDGGRVVETIMVDLGQLEPAVETVVFAASTQSGTFGQVPDLHIQVAGAADGAEVARFDSTGLGVETAVVLGELYRRGGGWRFRAVGQGYDSGLAGLGADVGMAVDGLVPLAGPGQEPAGAVASAGDPHQGHLPSQQPAFPPPVPASATPPVAPPAATAPEPAPPAAPVRLSKVTLSKDRPAVSLAKQGGRAGAMRVNLNWRIEEQRSGRGWLRRAGQAAPARSGIDLDLCALYELGSGRKGVVQALGNSFGSLQREPYIHLDGDDRTGAVESGENLTINLDHSADFRRILIFVTIYEGASSFAGLHATTTLHPQHGAPIEFFLDECTVPSRVCALALISNVDGELVVRREARYLVPERGVSPQRAVDHAYEWGMKWTPGRK